MPSDENSSGDSSEVSEFEEAEEHDGFLFSCLVEEEEEDEEDD